ncbi:class I SAM-dependent methyltransferase [Pelagicoccus sp. SDUM812002]|uniref:class I SAM-dependent methyltransferase n=1 Tax=Pelagicoccus sp. SDUM812002 TaxID=3041266 RepID=UPI00280DC900|nr:class I SAM-dependent methyltransferase [Pelagicoccus sp. SDUM812002]MDQ8186887.1 class I SAM-dependent methyltransferase [Pelagicoccus sp. SDUM812002]
MNKWDQRYSSKGFVYGTEPNDFLAEQAHRIPAGACLSLADGEGRNGVYLASLGYKVTSVDSSEVGLAKARQLAEQKGVELYTVHRDLADFQFEPSSFAGIVSIFCHLPPALRKEVYRKSVSALQPGGVLILEGYTPEQLSKGTGGPPTLDLLLSIDQLKQDLDGLDFLVAQETERDIQEGNLHTGIGSVAQVVAVKR